MAIPIKTIANNAIDTIFSLFETIQEDVEIVMVEGASTYNTQTGDIDKTGNFPKNVKAIFTTKENKGIYDADAFEKIGDEKRADWMMVIKRKDLGDLAIDVETKVIRPNGTTWFVTDVMEDPTNTFLEVSVRRGF